MNQVSNESVSNNSVKKTTEMWFENIIEDLKISQLAYTSDAVSGRQKEMFESLATNPDNTYERLVEMTREYYFKELISDFITELIKIRKIEKPKKLAMYPRGHKIMTWFEIPNDDWNAEKNIYLAEAKTNSKFEDSGYSVSVFIVEEGDEVSIPAHYVPVIE